jgi:hypothetical protein
MICDDGQRLTAQTYFITANSVHQVSYEDRSSENFIKRHKPLFLDNFNGSSALSVVELTKQES